MFTAERRPAFRPKETISEQLLVTSLADVVIEAGADLEYFQRINELSLVLTDDGRVVNPEVDERDLSEHLRFDSHKDRLESAAALAIRESLVTNKAGTLATWFSPPNESYLYKEGRVVVYYLEVESDQKKYRGYAIPVSPQDSEQFLFSAWRLSEFSEQQLVLDDTEDLRANPIIFSLPQGEQPWDFLGRYIHLEHVWEAISDGTVTANRAAAVEDSRAVAEAVMPIITNARSQHDRDRAIMYACELMSQRGRNIDLSLLCDLPGVSNGLVGGSLMNSFKEVGGEKKFVKKCGNCGVEINEYIGAGYVCFSCKGVYEGC